MLSSLQIYAWEGEGKGDVTVTVTLLPAPALSSPSNWATGVSRTPTFTWSAVSGATSYRILVGTSRSGLPTDPTASTGTGVVINAVPTGTSYTPASGVLSEGVTYYWEVHARSPTQYGTWSSKRSFTTGTTRVTVTLTLYVHEDSAIGPVLSGVRVTGQDGGGSSFDKITSTSGYVTITGTPGTWSFTASKTGSEYETNSWSQSITSITGTSTKHAFLAKIPVSLPTIGSFSVTISQGESGTTSFRVSNPNSFSIKVTGFLVTDYGGFDGEITATNLPLIAAGGMANVQLSVVDKGSSSGTYTIRFKLSGTP